MSFGVFIGNFLGFVIYVFDDEDGECSSLLFVVIVFRRLGFEINGGEVKEKNVRKKGDFNGKLVEYVRGSESKERISLKIVRLEGSIKVLKVDVMFDSKRMK